MMEGMTPDAPISIRIGSAERSRVAERLVCHFQAGQLERSELEARLGRAAQARTEDDLHQLTVDLPDVAPRRPVNLTGPDPAHPLRVTFDVIVMCLTTAALLCLLLWLIGAASEGGTALILTTVAALGALVVGAVSVYLIQRAITISRR